MIQTKPLENLTRLSRNESLPVIEWEDFDRIGKEKDRRIKKQGAQRAESDRKKPMNHILEVFETELKSQKLTVVEWLELPAREKRTIPVPDVYRKGPVGRWLLSDDALKGNLWRH